MNLGSRMGQQIYFCSNYFSFLNLGRDGDEGGGRRGRKEKREGRGRGRERGGDILLNLESL